METLTDDQVGEKCVEMLKSFLGKVRKVPKLKKVTRYRHFPFCISPLSVYSAWSKMANWGYKLHSSLYCYLVVNVVKLMR